MELLKYHSTTERRFRRENIFKLLPFLVFMSLFFSGGCKHHDNEPNPENPGYFKLVWKVRLPAWTYYSSPALNADQSVVYTGTSKFNVLSGDTTQVFVALNTSDGKRRWTYHLGCNVLRSAPAITPDGSVLIVVQLTSCESGIITGDELVSLSSAGTKKWSYLINHGASPVDVGLSTPAIAPDGTIFVAGDSLYAINPDGTLKWRALGKFDEMMRNSPVIGSDGTVYMVSHNVPLTAFNPADGSVKWSCELGINDHCFASPSIGPDGTIYVPTSPGILYAVSDQGSIKWTFVLSTAGFSGLFRSSPTIDKDGVIYFGLKSGSPSSALFALNPDGTVKWIFEPSDLPSGVPPDHFDIYSSPALGTDSLVFFGQEFGRVYALNKIDGSVTGMYETSQGITWPSPALDDKGVLYINDLDGYVFALKTTTTGLDPDAPWPKYRGNNQNCGRK